MAGQSNIEWTYATWNPIVGCSIVSPGCTNCYAMAMAARIEKMATSPMAEHVKVQTHYAGTTQKSKARTVWTGKVALAPDHIFTAPLRWRKPRRIFVNSMGDLFHESIPDEWIDKVFAVMALSPQHTFQVLTKRAERMRAWMTQERKRTPPVECIAELYVSNPDIARQFPFDARAAIGVGERGWPLPNVWLGVSAERQQEADERIPLLLQTPAAVRFVSLEPLLGPIRLDMLAREPDDYDRKIPGFATIEKFYRDALTGRDGIQWKDGYAETEGPHWPRLDWVIVGGESGPKARPMHPDWARSLRDQCAAAGVPFFFKQWGAWRPSGGWIDGALEHGMHGVSARTGKIARAGDLMCGNVTGNEWHGYGIIRRVGKKAAGRLLDNKQHNAFPNTIVSTTSEGRAA